jgi:para-aminobenzoate synthetase component 1
MDDPLALLAVGCRPWRQLAEIPDVPFIGGWIGFLAYEAGRFVEPAAGWKAADHRLPLSHWEFYDTVLIHDRRGDRWVVAGVEVPGGIGGATRPPLSLRIESIEDFVRACDRMSDKPCKRRTKLIHGKGEWNYGRSAYFSKISQALDYIRAGDIFQVNLARRFRAEMACAAPLLYERLCETNPAAHAAYLNVPGAQILSSSPELFLALRDGIVVTRPIKGTRPRGRTPIADEQSRRELANSDKDRAELNMIVDLERNDLGRVCEYGTIRVIDDGRIEAHPTVFHRTATIVGRPRENADAIDLLRATFPGGSITGAPKVRAMQIIHELEPDPRGAYCGAIGYIGVNGDMQLNLAIRTLTVADGLADLSVGSAIVADSDPEEEFGELEAKAAGMFAALGIDGRPGPEPALSAHRRREPALR